MITALGRDTTCQPLPKGVSDVSFSVKGSKINKVASNLISKPSKVVFSDFRSMNISEL